MEKNNSLKSKNVYNMKKRRLSLVALAALTVSFAYGQSFNKVETLDEVPEGVVVYALPSTTLHLTVEAVCESYTPGIYAKYAKKYLGIEVEQKESVSYKLGSIRMTPYIEADRGNNYILDLTGMATDAAPLSFLKFTSQGLVILSDDYKGKMSYWRFPSLKNGSENINAAITDNLTSTETTLYQTVKNSKGSYDKVAFKQSQVVEKSMEKKAQEAAALILSLREQRINIITGDTDATFSGDALRAAVEEITRLEEEYMSLFAGYTSISSTQMDFDIVPEAAMEEDMSIAFRLSEVSGLVSASEVAGRPIVIQITPEETVGEDAVAALEEPVITEKYTEKKSRSKEDRGSIFYRVPSVCNVKIIDGQDILMQSRVPVYQKGKTLTFPVDVLVR